MKKLIFVLITLMAFIVTLLASPAPAAPAPKAEIVSGQRPHGKMMPYGSAVRERYFQANEVSKNNASKLGGVWTDIESGRVQVGYTEGNQGFAETAIARFGNNVDLVQVKYSDADLEAVFEDSKSLEGVVEGSHDWRNNRIVLGFREPSDALLTRLYEKYGDVVVVENVESPPTRATRDEDTSPYWGGANYKIFSVYDDGFNDGNWGITHAPVDRPDCSMGFSFRTPQGYPRMLTAGHCYPTWTYTNSYGSPPNDHRNTGVRTDFDTGFYTHKAGSAIDSTFIEGYGTFQDIANLPQNEYGDIALINVKLQANGSTLDRDVGPRIWTGATNGSSNKYVHAVDNWSAMDDQVCYSGAKTGTQCIRASEPEYYVTDPNSYYNDGELFDNQAKAEADWGTCLLPGDSGAPVYREYGGGVMAMGILSGGGASAGGDNYISSQEQAWASCNLFYTEIGNVFERYSGTLDLAPL